MLVDELGELFNLVNLSLTASCLPILSCPLCSCLAPFIPAFMSFLEVRLAFLSCFLKVLLALLVALLSALLSALDISTIGPAPSSNGLAFLVFLDVFFNVLTADLSAFLSALRFSLSSFLIFFWSALSFFISSDLPPRSFFLTPPFLAVNSAGFCWATPCCPNGCSTPGSIKEAAGGLAIVCWPPIIFFFAPLLPPIFLDVVPPFLYILLFIISNF